jgi:hypothetical protein
MKNCDEAAALKSTRRSAEDSNKPDVESEDVEENFRVPQFMRCAATVKSSS